MLPLIQVLPTHKSHPANLVDVLQQLGYERVRVTDSRRANPSVVVVIQCQKCQRNSDLNLALHLNNPLAPVLFIRFEHGGIGCNVIPVGVINHHTLPRTIADELVRSLVAGPTRKTRAA
jgi:hypothetical protein